MPRAVHAPLRTGTDGRAGGLSAYCMSLDFFPTTHSRPTMQRRREAVCLFLFLLTLGPQQKHGWMLGDWMRTLLSAVRDNALVKRIWHVYVSD